MTSPTPKRVVVLASLDTKSAEARFLADALERHGLTPWLIDTGVAGYALLPGDTTRTDILHAVGQTEQSIMGLSKTELMATAAAGGQAVLLGMARNNELAAVIGIGGGQGTWMGTTIMKALPYDIPKFMVSTIAHRSGQYVGSSNIWMIPSVVDIAGLNVILRRVLVDAAASLAGIVNNPGRVVPEGRPMVAMTMFGVTSIGAEHARRSLEAAGYEVAVFHANGLGGATMEEMIAEGAFVGVLDFTTTELTDELAGGQSTAGPNRLEAAARMGVPQVIVPGAIDVINLKPEHHDPSLHEGRVVHRHTPTVSLMRTDLQQSAALGAIIADKVARARGPVAVVIPAQGFSALDDVGQPFWSVAADEAFTASLRDRLPEGIPVEVLPMHINDAAFASFAAERLLAMLAADRSPAH